MSDLIKRFNDMGIVDDNSVFGKLLNPKGQLEIINEIGFEKKKFLRSSITKHVCTVTPASSDVDYSSMTQPVEKLGIERFSLQATSYWLFTKGYALVAPRLSSKSLNGIDFKIWKLPKDTDLGLVSYLYGLEKVHSIMEEYKSRKGEFNFGTLNDFSEVYLKQVGMRKRLLNTRESNSYSPQNGIELEELTDTTLSDGFEFTSINENQEDITESTGLDSFVKSTLQAEERLKAIKKSSLT